MAFRHSSVAQYELIFHHCLWHLRIKYKIVVFFLLLFHVDVKIEISFHFFSVYFSDFRLNIVLAINFSTCFVMNKFRNFCIWYYKNFNICTEWGNKTMLYFLFVVPRSRICVIFLYQILSWRFVSYVIACWLGSYLGLLNHSKYWKWTLFFHLVQISLDCSKKYYVLGASAKSSNGRSRT